VLVKVPSFSRKDAAGKTCREGNLPAHQPRKHFKKPIGFFCLEQIADSPASDRFEQILVVFRHGKNYNLDSGLFRLNETGGGQTIKTGHLNIHEDYLGFQGAGLFNRLKSVASSPDDFDSPN